MLVVVTLVRSRFESHLDSTQLTNLKRERVLNVPNLYGVFFVFLKTADIAPEFESMGFQVFGLVMGWHLIGQWQCRAESFSPPPLDAIRSETPPLRYGCHGTDLALYAKGSGGNGQVGSSELCWCESSSMGTGWPETGDWRSRGAWTRLDHGMSGAHKNSERHCGQGWCNSTSRGLRASKNRLLWTLKTVQRRFADCFNATPWILCLNTKINSPHLP